MQCLRIGPGPGHRQRGWARRVAARDSRDARPPTSRTELTPRNHLSELSLSRSNNLREGNVGSRRWAVSGEDEACDLRAGPTERAARAGHGPSAGHRPGGVLPSLVRGIERAVAHTRIATSRGRGYRGRSSVRAPRPCLRGRAMDETTARTLRRFAHRPRYAGFAPIEVSSAAQINLGEIKLTECPSVATAQGPAGGLAAQDPARAPRAASGPRGLAGHRGGGRQPAPPVHLSRDPRSDAHDRPARGLPSA